MISTPPARTSLATRRRRRRCSPNLAFAATDRLAEFPQSGRIVPERGQPDIREVFVWNYRVIYALDGDDIVVLTVHHGARTLAPSIT